MSLIDDLEAGRILAADFSHRAHVEAGWLLLGSMGLPFHEAYPRLRAILFDLASSVGRADRYNDTITLAFMAMIHEALRDGASATDFAAFAQASPHLFDPATLRRVYPAARLGLEAARSGLVLPVRPAA